MSRTISFHNGNTDLVPQRNWEDTHIIHAALDIHADDPVFGCWFIADELSECGITAGRATCSIGAHSSGYRKCWPRSAV
ncbi:Integrase, catalytic region [Rhodococcus wratislaviensis]|uniref:Integrase, catalytic region n=1 Tax=Rhodococcus wratislaviensis TaxID=44752 RepID=A0A402CDD5_RHOWR|nr:Integrase, catalytic region [Rhodococcus wratislaviensis]